MRTKRIVAMIVLLLSVVSAATAQTRGNSGLPPGPGNPIAALRGATAGLQTIEPNLVLIRGTVAGNDGTVLQGSGFSTIFHPVAGTPFGRYEVVFTQPFLSPPTVTLGLEGGFDGTPPPTGQFVQVIQIDLNAGGVQTTGFTVYVAQPSDDPSAAGEFGAQNWHFMAVGPR